MGKFKNQNGFRLERGPTKREVFEDHGQRINQLADAIQQLQMLLFRNLQQVVARMGALERQCEVIDYRSVATRSLLIDKNVFADAEHLDRARVLRIADFEEESKKDDEKRQLLPVEGDAQLGQFATVEVETRYPEVIEVISVADPNVKESLPHPQAGKKVEELSTIRSKFMLGSGTFLPELELKLVGMKIGESRDVALKLSPAYGEYAGKDVIFNVKLFDLKKGPEAPKAAPTDGEKEAN